MWLQTIRADFQFARLKWGLIVSTSYIVPILEVSAVFLIYAIIDSTAHQQAAGIISKVFSYIGISSPTDFTITLILAIAALSAISAAVGSRYLNQVILGRLRIHIYVGHCHRLIDTFLHTNLRNARKVGKDKIINSVFNDCGALQGSVELGLNTVAAIWAIGLCLIGAAFLSWKLLIAGVALYVLPILASKHIFRWMRALGDERVRSQERSLSHLTDVLGGFERTKTDGLEALLSRNTNHMLQDTQKWKIDKRIAEAQQVAILDGLSMAGILIVLYLGVVLLKLELSLMLALFLLFSRLRGHVATMTRAAMEFRAQIAPVYRYFELLSALGRHQFDSHEIAVSPETVAPLVLSNINFKYHELPVLRGVTFTANKGEKILITGASGQGKSTLVEILCGLLPPNEGTISIAGEPFDEAAFYRFRPAITLVTPSVYLFRGTLRENLTMGRTISEEQLILALEQAQLSEVVDAIDGGLDGDIGINGDKLSLGQRQRVILARVFLDRPKLLLMDEATSNLNPSLEAEIIDKLQTYVDPDCIIIMIAHKAPKNFQHTRSYEMRSGELIELANASSVQHTEFVK
jgi:ABC-type bacteriocin/lantibiotic exporter with double-glycine peptidase domain